MGRRVIWSDPQLQTFSKKFVCVVEECFFLYPPAWMKNPPNPASTNLFTTYVKNAPKLWPANTSTHQGMYIMTADGGFLSGKFARQSNSNAREIMNAGWDAWNKKRKGESKSVPDKLLPLYGGDEIEKGGLKLRLVYRDLPRGEVRRPGNAQFPNPYNMGWHDFSPAEARTFSVAGNIADPLLQKLALTKLKDAVRGQMQGWKPEDWKGGQIHVSEVKRDGFLTYLKITGRAKMESEKGLSFAPDLLGYAVYDNSAKEFKDFKLLAFGQRTGRGGANGRATDLGPAPLAIAMRMYR